MNVLLVRLSPDKETIGLQHVMICEPLELEYLVGNIPDDLKDDVACTIVDQIVDRRSLASYIDELAPSLIAFTGYIAHVNIIKSASQQIKADYPMIKIAVGGVHAEVVPTDFVDPSIDFVINANGIDTFNELVRGILVDQSSDQLKNIAGVYESGKVSVKKNTFNYAYPDRESTSRYRHRYYYMFHNPCTLIKTSFGCPFNCSFCFCKEITDGQYFRRDVVDVLDELSTIEETEVYIVDDDFLFDEKWLRAFIDGLRSRGIQKKFLVYGRSDFIAQNEALMGELSSVGLKAVIVGLESFKDTDLDKYNKHSSLELNEKAISVLKGYEIELYGTFILPLDYSKHDFKLFRKWLRQIDITFINLQPLTPLKGTEIYESYRSDFLIGEDEFEKWDMAHVVLKPQAMSVRAFYYEMIKTYYHIVVQPKHIWRLIQKYGLRENLKLFVGSSRVTLQYYSKILRG